MYMSINYMLTYSAATDARSCPETPKQTNDQMVRS